MNEGIGVFLLFIAGGFLLAPPLVGHPIDQFNPNIYCLGVMVNTYLFGSYCAGYFITLFNLLALTTGMLGIILIVLPSSKEETE